MAIDTSTEVQALQTERGKLSRLYARGTEAEARLKTLKARHETLEAELGAAAGGGRLPPPARVIRRALNGTGKSRRRILRS